MFFLAGQRNATNGNAGLWAPACLPDLASSLLDFAGGESPFFFFLALYEEEGAGMIGMSPKAAEIRNICRQLTRTSRKRTGRGRGQRVFRECRAEAKIESVMAVLRIYTLLSLISAGAWVSFPMPSPAHRQHWKLPSLATLTVERFHKSSVEALDGWRGCGVGEGICCVSGFTNCA